MPLPSNNIPRSENPEDRILNKDGTIKRRTGERFVGDVVRHYCSGGWGGTLDTVTEVVGNLVKVRGHHGHLHKSFTELVKKAK